MHCSYLEPLNLTSLFSNSYNTTTSKLTSKWSADNGNSISSIVKKKPPLVIWKRPLLNRHQLPDANNAALESPPPENVTICHITTEMAHPHSNNANELLVV